MVHATGGTPLEQQLAGQLGHNDHTTTGPNWHPWQSDTGQWWATRRGRYRNPMTLGPAHDRAELAGIVEREGGYQLDGRAG
ncbi:MAG TPA: hypothetical protein VGI74_12985 [Streptosporangiaceae bacterium]|jgi:hypothetical protein